MKAKLLVSTAVILTGFAFAAAQEMPRGKSEAAPPNQGAQGAPRGDGSRQGMPERQNDGSREQGKGKQAQPKPDPDRNRSQTAGPSEQNQGERNQQQREQGKSKQQAQPKTDQPRTTGQREPEQDQRDKAKQATQPKVGQERDQRPATGQGQRDQGKQAQPKSDRSGTQSDQRQSDRQQGRTDDRAQGRVDVNVEQRTRIRQTILSRSDIPRVDRVNFTIRVGTTVPSRIRVVAVPPILIEYWPQFRNNVYFVVNDEIVILDNRRRIVAVVPVDTAGSGPRPGGAQQVVDLSADEVRQVQRVLVERGFEIQVDGVFGANTRRALLQFQERQGLQATGRIDSRTIAELGVSIRTGGDSSTTGQGGGGQDDADRPGRSINNPGERQSPMSQPNDSNDGTSQRDGQMNTPSPTTGQGRGATERSPGQGSGGVGNPANMPKGAPSGGNPTGTPGAGGGASGAGSPSGGAGNGATGGGSSR